MMSAVVEIDWTNFRTSVPAFFTIAGMAFTYSIWKGIGIGIVSDVLISLVCFIVDRIKYSPPEEEKVMDLTAPEKPAWPISLVTVSSQYCFWFISYYQMIYKNFNKTHFILGS
jgi:xanthine/uracil/vitamin C permease (AzgA family)